MVKPMGAIVKRELIEEIEPFLKRPEYISIIGPRQSGKTTLLGMIRDCLRGKFKVDKDLIATVTFEDRRQLLQFEKEPVSFVKSYIPSGEFRKFYLMIDEFQYAEDGGQKLKLIYDTVKGVKIFITGSSSMDIKAMVGKFMVGRMLNFHLYPFGFGEYLRGTNGRLEKIYKENSSEIARWLVSGGRSGRKEGEDVFHEEMVREFERFSIWGGYPAVVLAESDVERRKLLADIYNNYILKDIKSLLELATERNLFLLSQYLATQIGNIVVYQNLGQSAGLDYRNLKKHLNILEETFVCSEVRPFFKNRQKELSKNPKIFFVDMGFRNNLVQNMNGLAQRSDAGAIAENTCFIRLAVLCKERGRINFWRTKTGGEVDFVLNLEGSVIPVEIKYSDFVAGKISKSLAGFVDSFNPRRALVLTKNYFGDVRRGGARIKFAPVYYL